MLPARVAEADDEQVERRGVVAPTEEPHYPSESEPGSAGASPSAASAAARLALGRLALDTLLALLALDLLGLGLDLDDRCGDVRDHGLVRIVEEDDAFDRRQILEPERVADLHPADVGLDRLGDLHRQRLDVDRRRWLREHAALLDAGRVLGAVEMDVDGRLDRDVESHFLQVDVADVAADRVALVLLEDRRLRRRLAVDDDVEHRVQARRAGQRRAQLALVDGERLRRRTAVEDARNEALLAQAPRLGRAEPLTCLYLQTKSVAGHGGGL